jgi:heme oxygenase (biliverdin-IX-beta and delta-forming)
LQTSSAPATFLDVLKAQTRPEHDAIEHAIRLTSPSITVEIYRRTLERFYGFYRPLEPVLLDPGQWPDAALDMTARRKTARLVADLQDLEVDVARLAICGDMPPLDTPSDRWGCLYVIEGSTLGGQVIGRHLERRLGLTPAFGARFLQPYGARTGPMWQAVRSGLTAHASSEETQRRVVASAIATFRGLCRWMSGEIA